MTGRDRVPTTLVWFHTDPDVHRCSGASGTDPSLTTFAERTDGVEVGGDPGVKSHRVGDGGRDVEGLSDPGSSSGPTDRRQVVPQVDGPQDVLPRPVRKKRQVRDRSPGPSVLNNSTESKLSPEPVHTSES